MGLKPIITFEDGDSKILDKVRGEKSIVPAIVKLATQNMIPQTHYAIITGSVKDTVKNCGLRWKGSGIRPLPSWRRQGRPSVSTPGRT